MKRQARGQSLVELALIFPIILLMFLGLVEIGYAIRGEFILIQIVAETGRNSVRYKTIDPYADPIDYGPVWYHFDNIRQPYDLADEDYRTYFHLFETSVGRPCLERPCFGPCRLVPAGMKDTTDDYFMPPKISQMGALDKASLIDYGKVQEKLLEQEFLTQCQKEQRDAAWIPTVHRTVIVEMFHDQDQLLGFPFFEFVNPIPLYATDTIRWTGK